MPKITAERKQAIILAATAALPDRQITEADLPSILREFDLTWLGAENYFTNFDAVSALMATSQAIQGLSQPPDQSSSSPLTGKYFGEKGGHVHDLGRPTEDEAINSL